MKRPLFSALTASDQKGISRPMRLYTARYCFGKYSAAAMSRTSGRMPATSTPGRRQLIDQTKYASGSTTPTTSRASMSGESTPSSSGTMANSDMRKTLLYIRK